MFLANEPRDIFYDSKHRSFYANAPLQVSISDEHQLLVKFFSPVTIHDVTILCRFNNISTEFLELAHFDVIHPFMEAAFPLPVVGSDRTFTTSSVVTVRLHKRNGACCHRRYLVARWLKT